MLVLFITNKAHFLETKLDKTVGDIICFTCLGSVWLSINIKNWIVVHIGRERQDLIVNWPKSYNFKYHK